MTNMQAALGVAQLERFEQIIAKKRWMGAAYSERLQEIPGMRLPVEESWAKQVFWMYGLVLDESRGMDAAEFARRLEAQGVQTRPFFLGMHEQPVFWARGLFKGERYPVAERLAKQGLYIPSGLALTNEQLEETCNVVKRILL
jgi:perosamine synthetase